MVHLPEGFLYESDVERGSVLNAELLSVKEDMIRLEKSLSEMENRAKELGKANLAFLNQVFLTLFYFLRFFSLFLSLFLLFLLIFIPPLVSII